MTDAAVRDEIAFIRRAIEEGRGYAAARSGDALVWGVLIAAAALGTYARIRGWWRVDPDWLWIGLIALGWVFSLRQVLGLVRNPVRRPLNPTVQVIRMLWLGCGIFLTLLYGMCFVSDVLRENWIVAISAGIMGIAFFAMSALANLAWMRWIAVGWWLGQIGTYVLRDQAEVYLLMAALWLVLLALPGLVLLRGVPAPKAAE
jgi:hypothetical protein